MPEGDPWPAERKGSRFVVCGYSQQDAVVSVPGRPAVGCDPAGRLFSVSAQHHPPCLLLHPTPGHLREFMGAGVGLSNADVNPSLAECSLPLQGPLHWLWK